jgi:hypothetical protein
MALLRMKIRVFQRAAAAFMLRSAPFGARLEARLTGG